MTAHPPAQLLVVDDDPLSRRLVQGLLAPEGYDVAQASDGNEALVLLGQRPFDLVLADVLMPGMDGLELCRRMRAHPVHRMLPVLLITSLESREDMVRGIEAGADEFLTKPLERVVLHARVRSVLRFRDRYRTQAGPPDVEGLLRDRRERLMSDARLSAREREVLELLLLGRTHSDIGAALGITERTSKFHQANLLQKLGAESRLDLMRLFS